MDSPLPKTFLNRLHLRDNWPLWCAGILCVLAVIYLLTYLLSPLRYPYEGAIIYPLAVLYSTTVVLLGCAALISLLVVVGWVSFVTGGKGFIWIVPMALMTGVILCIASVEMGIAGILGALILLIVSAFRQDRKQGIATLFVAVAAVFLFIPTFAALFVGLHHRDSLMVGDKRYNLALLSDSDMDCHDEYFMVYECDSLGLICRLQERLNGYSKCLSTIYHPKPSQVSLIADTTQGQVYVELDGERFPVAP